MKYMILTAMAAIVAGLMVGAGCATLFGQDTSADYKAGYKTAAIVEKMAKMSERDEQYAIRFLTAMNTVIPGLTNMSPSELTAAADKCIETDAQIPGECKVPAEIVARLAIDAFIAYADMHGWNSAKPLEYGAALIAFDNGMIAAFKVK